MNATRILRIAAGYAWRLPSCAGAYVAGAAASAVLVTTLGMPLPKVPEQADEQTMASCMVPALLVMRGRDTKADELFARSPLCSEQATVGK